jgi:hypothetical protein
MSPPISETSPETWPVSPEATSELSPEESPDEPKLSPVDPFSPELSPEVPLSPELSPLSPELSPVDPLNPLNPELSPEEPLKVSGQQPSAKTGMPAAEMATKRIRYRPMRGNSHVEYPNTGVSFFMPRNRANTRRSSSFT